MLADKRKVGGEWNPLIAKIDVSGTGVGQLRTLESIDGKVMIERLEEVDDAQKSYRYSVLSGIPAADCTGMLNVKPASKAGNAASQIEYPHCAPPSSSTRFQSRERAPTIRHASDCRGHFPDWRRQCIP